MTWEVIGILEIGGIAILAIIASVLYEKLGLNETFSGRLYIAAATLLIALYGMSIIMIASHVMVR